MQIKVYSKKLAGEIIVPVNDNKSRSATNLFKNNITTNWDNDYWSEHSPWDRDNWDRVYWDRVYWDRWHDIGIPDPDPRPWEIDRWDRGSSK